MQNGYTLIKIAPGLSAECRWPETNRTNRLGERILDRFNLNLFFALDAILNSPTLTEAARRTHLTQPALSVSLKRLRGFFRDELVVYHGGETTLTALALILRPRVRELLQGAREIQNLSASFDPEHDEGTVTITAPDVLEIILVGALIPLMTAQAPRMKLTSLPFNYQPIETMFRQPLDVAVIAEPFAGAHLASEPLFSDTLSCMVWAGNQTHGDAITEEQYRDARHVGISLASERLTHPVGTILQDTYMRQNQVVRASSFSALPHMIIGNDMVATVLSSYARLCARTLPVRIVETPMPMPRIDFVAQWQPYRASEPFIQWVLALIRTATASLREGGQGSALDPLKAEP